MKINRALLFLVILTSILFLSSQSRSQNQNGRNKRLIDLYGQTAYSYLLSANRPGFGVDAYINDKGKASLSAGVSFNNETFDIPVALSYALSESVELSAGVSPFTQSYDFAGSKISGFGDAFVSAKYLLPEAGNFSHALQVLLKLPTASSQTELGTGKFDFHFGAAQSFFYESFGYDLSLELNLLKRKDITARRKYVSTIQAIIDSVNSQYDYAYEPELVISGGPSLSLGKKLSVYSGLSFSRNMRLNYNSTQVYGGFGVSVSKVLSLGAGGSYSFGDASYWLISSSFYFIF